MKGSAAESDSKLPVEWYLEPPFNDAGASTFFRTQNWWLEFDENHPGPKSIPGDPRDAALYELVRRHWRVGLLLMGALPVTGIERFLLEHARAPWLLLAAELREIWSDLVRPKKGNRSRQEDWLSIISAFESSERGRKFDFQKLHGPKRKEIQPRKSNQNQRRAFERVCARAFVSLKVQ
jgi:hypothetical protein